MPINRSSLKEVTDNENIYAMTLGSGLLKSQNDGLEWKNANTGFGPLRLHTFEVKLFRDQLFAAQWHGLYYSKDAGAHWQVIKNGLPDSTAFTTLAVTRDGLIAGLGMRLR